VPGVASRISIIISMSYQPAADVPKAASWQLQPSQQEPPRCRKHVVAVFVQRPSDGAVLLMLRSDRASSRAWFTSCSNQQHPLLQGAAAPLKPLSYRIADAGWQCGICI
jgi:hypothetical protein